MNKVRKSLAVVLVVILEVLCFKDNLLAATYGNEASSGQYVYTGVSFIGQKGFWVYKNNKNWNLFYSNKKLTPTIYHTKYSGAEQLIFAYSAAQGATKTSSWSVNGSITQSVSAAIKSLFETSISASVGLGYGEAYARSYSFTTNAQVGKTIKDDAPTGYYTRVPGYTFYKMEVRVLNVSDYALLHEFYFDEPYGEAVIYTIYSNDNKTWKTY